MSETEETAAEPRAPRRAEMALFIGVALATCALLFVVLQLWRADLNFPFEYSGDATWGLATAKGMIEHGWIWVNPSTGAPGEMNLLDYPGTDLLSHVVLKLISLVARTPAATINVFYLLGYPLSALSALWALRRLGVSRGIAAATAVLYAFLPNHLLRGEAHLFLSAYYLVPLACLLALELMGDTPPLVVHGRLRLRDRSAAPPLAVAVVIGATGVYYAFFTCFFLLLAGVWGWWRTKERERLTAAAVLIGGVLLAALLAVSPFLWYRVTHGSNPGAADRNAGALEVYGLKITQLVLPVRHHRVAVLANIREQYQDGLATLFGTHMDNESDFAALGILGAIGFVLLLLALLFGNRSGGTDPPRDVVGSAAVLNIAALLLSTSSGFCLFVGFVLPQIRAYNRISVFVAFFALLALGAAVDRILSRWPKAPAWVAWAIAAMLLAVGIADQTTPAMVPKYEAVSAEWKADGEFVARLEADVPSQAMVFQLPYVPFPEYPPVHGMVDYDHFKPYLHSSSARWSYGAVKGRETSDWQGRTATLAPGELLQVVRQAGFSVVWIDRAGYADAGQAILSDFAHITASEPALSADGSYAYFVID